MGFSSISLILVGLLNRKVTMIRIEQDLDDREDCIDDINIQALLTMQTTIYLQ